MLVKILIFIVIFFNMNAAFVKFLTVRSYRPSPGTVQERHVKTVASWLLSAADAALFSCNSISYDKEALTALVEC
jgi:hypothetical protein